MRLLNTQQRIIELFSIFVTQIKCAAILRQTDINRVSENVLIPLFSEIYGYKNLKNLNYFEDMNFPGIDLGDEIARVCIQVTSTSTNEKVKDTLRKFTKNEQFTKYERLIIYILTEKQSSYSDTKYADIIKEKFFFNPKDDIKDYKDLLYVIGSFQVDKASRILNILESNFGDNRPLFLTSTDEEKTETLYANLLEVHFPETLYIADLNLDSSKPPQKARGKKNKYRRNNVSQRNIIQSVLNDYGLRFSADWECHENQIITFHDLEEENIPLSKIIDKGTITSLEPEEYYSIDENYERIFKSLLRRCLQQKLYHQQILWQNENNIFIFSEIDNQDKRVESWHGKRDSERIVYERTMKNNKPEEILHCKHLGFKPHFKIIDKQFYLMITPEWFFSSDGYRRSRYSKGQLDWLKRRERNSEVCNQLKFIVYFLKHDKPPSLFDQRVSYSFLQFGDLVILDSTQVLNDADWKPQKSEEDDEDKRQLLIDYEN